MSNSYFQFKSFIIRQDRTAMKVTTDACLFGAWVAEKISSGSSKNKSHLLDIGTGTGLLTLMVAQKTDLTIDGIEIDPDAFEQAKENVATSKWKEQINILSGDARNLQQEITYDYIVSNPPFYESDLVTGNEKKDLARHGLNLKIEELLTVIGNKLAKTGRFFILIPFSRNEAIEELFREKHLQVIQRTFVRQSVNHDYFRVMLEGKSLRGEEEVKINEISIWNEKQEYTPEFIELLRDYYLYL